MILEEELENYPYILGDYIYFFIRDEVDISGDVEIFKYVLGKIVMDYLM